MYYYWILEKAYFFPTYEAGVLVIGLQRANFRSTLNAFNMNYIEANTTFQIMFRVFGPFLASQALQHHKQSV